MEMAAGANLEGKSFGLGEGMETDFSDDPWSMPYDDFMDNDDLMESLLAEPNWVRCPARVVSY